MVELQLKRKDVDVRRRVELDRTTSHHYTSHMIAARTLMQSRNLLMRGDLGINIKNLSRYSPFGYESQ